MKRADGLCGCEARVEGVGVEDGAAQEADVARRCCGDGVVGFWEGGVGVFEEEAEEVEGALSVGWWRGEALVFYCTERVEELGVCEEPEKLGFAVWVAMEGFGEYVLRFGDYFWV